MNETHINPLSLEGLEEQKAKSYFMLDPVWVKSIKELNPEGYAELVADWYDCELECKQWRQKQHELKAYASENKWAQMPTLVMPKMLENQMHRRFGEHWGSFNFLKYGVWLFYPRLRTRDKWGGRKRGVSRKRMDEGFTLYKPAK